MDAQTDVKFSLEAIETRHRQEKKELQATIQGLKKTIKNDKSKKKELTSEISRLEQELERRHQKELDEQKVNHVEDDEIINNSSLSNLEKPKVSKAQKRRERKSQQEKLRDEEIRVQEKDNLNGPRNIELQAILEKLKSIDLEIYPVPSDGDCLYKAISHQLAVTRQKSMSVQQLRQEVAEYIKLNKDDFIPFMTNPVTNDLLTDAEFKDYCNKIVETKVWGGQLEVRALSHCLKCPICIIQASGPETIEQGNEFEGPKLIISYHRHMYSLGEHYNSTQKINEDIDK